MNKTWISFILLSLFFLGGFEASAIRTDTVFLYNGDRITGEIKYMSDNRLSYKTDRAGTITIEWPEIAKINSFNYFDIMLATQERLYGTLSFADSVGFVSIKLGTDERIVPIANIINIERIKTTFWQRIKYSLGVNLSYAKANENLQLNWNLNVTYRSIKFVHSISTNSVITNNASSNLTQRVNSNYSMQALHNTTWFSTYSAQYEKNTELNIDGRYMLFAGAGYYFLRKPTKELYSVAGLAGNQEVTISEPVETTTNLEIAIQGAYHQFRFRNPMVDLFIDLQTYTSLSDLGRFRLDFEGKILWELFNDFKWTITLYNNFDSKQPGTGLPNNDWSILTGITYTP